MKTVQLQKINGNWEYLTTKIVLKNPLVLVFGNRFLLEDENIYNEIRAIFKQGHLVFGSTAGDISSETVADQSITITAIEFEKSTYVIKRANVLSSANKIDSFQIGKELIQQFTQEGLRYVFLVSEGSFINASQLTKGMNAATNNNLLITGALCADAARFEKTVSSYNENPISGEIIAIGLYGESLEVSFAINGGWTPFGPERIVTKSKGNILYELDNKPALNLYKKYLGDKSKELPGAALLYPLKVKSTNNKQSIVRTILNINEADNSMILAGDILENSKVQLMMTNVDNIVNAAELAAINASELRTKKAELAILVSCIGRKLVLDQRVEEEVEEVVEVIGTQTTVCGLYSYGEIAPFNGENNCQLHNQTMTITLISE
ncbi:FIST C-terminal domain-containing protein [Tenacibaculum finnmarkense genomovar finnmarkense]|uniref:FIST signal transduction protein n=1 Tax=Tenacibaculum finnmarkense TaxID=2781243 RepID=UPI001E31AA11|nr:FIST N-terminal domain-containing protein [Tenacibaculum finnmarkense]MCD8416965.1 FIST C-terminal domain-containing protein [Tenacibaculum finnmarkense genomovar finnmarkense]MCG8185396.1 FIST C-terminal domain-containing protein [Tenacibaculum finnmarkense genomovar finnmarkense]MCG8201780.1 FIST C-terminal domain-containing protein [Tenacibaculum finnmarkense genomovar finnmarkense]MCG8209471.1 FIST C-terminal domain-containing protein [Tenacibaculum finnmarkense genomovar finnmarkense]M